MKKRSDSVSVFVGLCLIWIGFFILGIGIGFSFNGTIWQFSDGLVENLVLSLRGDNLTLIMKIISQIGYFGTIFGWITLLVSMVYKKMYRLGVMALVMSIGSVLIGSLMKSLVHRHRPELIGLVVETSKSFPSLHALTSVVFYLFLAYFFYHIARKFEIAFSIFLFGLAMILLIGFSRIYLGVHYFSDVIAGFWFGVSWFIFVLFAEKSFCMIVKRPIVSEKI